MVWVMLNMVIRLQLHKLCIILGIIICTVSLCTIPDSSFREVLQSTQKAPALLIIDPGHGGADGGAVGIDGVRESKINLEIANKLNLLGKLFGIQTIMTRSSEDIDYPEEATGISERKVADQKARLRLIQDYPYAILYSIHQNAYPSEKVTGFQVLYGHDENSQKLGNLLQKRYNEAISSQVGRVAAEISDDIFIMKHCGCTAVLVECGFITNRNECELLQTQAYQTKLALIMLGTYMEFVNL